MDAQQHIKSKNVASIAFGALTILLLFGVLFIVKGFLHALILGVIGATMLMPLHRKIEKGICYIDKRLFRKRRNRAVSIEGHAEEEVTNGERRAAALCSVALVFFCVVIPLTFFILTLINQGQNTLADARTWLEKGPDGRTKLAKHLEELDEKYQISRRWSQLNALNMALDFGEMESEPIKNETDANDPEQKSENVEPAAVETAKDMKTTDAETDVKAVSGEPKKTDTVQQVDKKSIERTNERAAAEFQELVGKLTVLLQKGLTTVVKSLMGVVKQIWLLVVNFFIMLLVMFFGFRDGPMFVKYVQDISPFSDKVQEQILDRISEVSRAVLFGILGTALVQSIIAMIIFRIVKIPALLWGSLLGICSLIPFIGTSLVWIPITIYFLLIGQPMNACFVLVGCGGIVANVDNFMRPAFICGGRTGMSYIVLFCSLLGGLQTFGLAGVVYGPLICGLCALCLYIFGTQYKNRSM